jgi:hypothetical protein
MHTEQATVDGHIIDLVTTRSDDARKNSTVCAP